MLVYRLRFVSVTALEIVMGVILQRSKNQVHEADVVLLATKAAVLGGS